MLEFKIEVPRKSDRVMVMLLAFEEEVIRVMYFFYLPYLSSIYEKAMCHYVLDGKSALAWELPFPGHLSST